MTSTSMGRTRGLPRVPNTSEPLALLVSVVIAIVITLVTVTFGIVRLFVAMNTPAFVSILCVLLIVTVIGWVAVTLSAIGSTSLFKRR
jgi:hypothetical protein